MNFVDLCVLLDGFEILQLFLSRFFDYFYKA